MMSAFEKHNELIAEDITDKVFKEEIEKLNPNRNQVF